MNKDEFILIGTAYIRIADIVALGTKASNSLWYVSIFLRGRTKPINSRIDDKFVLDSIFDLKLPSDANAEHGEDRLLS